MFSFVFVFSIDFNVLIFSGNLRFVENRKAVRCFHTLYVIFSIVYGNLI